MATRRPLTTLKPAKLIVRVLGTLAVMALLSATWALGDPSPALAAFNDTDGDGTIDIAELLAGSDPYDAASTPESAGGELYLGQPLCSDGVDNDNDGLTDANDPGCVDTDGDLVDDPIELLLGSDPNNADSIPEHSMIDAILATFSFVTFQCDDGLDNDLDGLIDDMDPGCAPFDTDEDGYDDVTEKTFGSDPNDSASTPENEEVSPGSCADGVDNDGDGAVDGDESSCNPATPSPPSTPTGIPVSEDTPATPTAQATPHVERLPATGLGPGAGNRSIVYILMAAAGVAASGGGLALLVGLSHLALRALRPSSR